MRRAWLLAVVLLGCASSSPPGPPPVPAPPRFPELAGPWSGHADTTDYGRVSASFFVGDDGSASVTATALGHVVRERFRVVAWDGRELTISDGSTLTARRDGDALVVEHPVVGVVRLSRPEK